MGCMGELDLPAVLKKRQSVQMEVDGGAKAPGADRVLCPGPQAGGSGGFLCSGREHAGVQDLVDYTIWVTGGLFICAV